jgi:hypothetical protein
VLLFTTAPASLVNCGVNGSERTRLAIRAENFPREGREGVGTQAPGERGRDPRRAGGVGEQDTLGAEANPPGAVGAGNRDEDDVGATGVLTRL